MAPSSLGYHEDHLRLEVPASSISDIDASTLLLQSWNIPVTRIWILHYSPRLKLPLRMAQSDHELIRLTHFNHLNISITVGDEWKWAFWIEKIPITNLFPIITGLSQTELHVWEGELRSVNHEHNSSVTVANTDQSFSASKWLNRLYTAEYNYIGGTAMNVKIKYVCTKVATEKAATTKSIRVSLLSASTISQ